MYIEKIVFFHFHVNGDSFYSRKLVKHIMDSTKDLNLTYYYTAPRSVISHCDDLGILPENFNVIQSPTYEFYLLENNILFINVWMGVYLDQIEDLSNYEICALCLNNYIYKINKKIRVLNDNLNLNIEELKLSNEDCLMLTRNYDFYDLKFIENFITKNKEKYEKIVLLCNNEPTTFITLTNITRRYIAVITKKLPNYLFITFSPTIYTSENVISIEQICNQNNNAPYLDNGIIFSYLSKLCDKAILLPTGLSFTCFNDQYIKNKFLMLFDYDVIGNPNNCIYCINDRKKLCTSRFGWDISIFEINFKDKNLNYRLCEFLEYFLKIPCENV